MFQIVSALLAVMSAEDLALSAINVLLLLMTASVVLAVSVPGLNMLLLYGKTREASTKHVVLLPGLDYFFSIYLPKRYFVHFYVVSVVCSLAVIAIKWDEHSPNGWVLTGLLLVQGLRRLLECIFLEKPNPKALIHISHYLVGILFYTLVNAIAYLAFSFPATPLSLCTALTITIFTIASIYQYCFHLHLVSLVKYTLPSYSLFRLVACPHYFAEIFIYASFVFVTPRACRPSIYMTVVWVLINLSASAKQTQVYYQQKFTTAQPYAIIPYIY
jgi:3-oxo-5-alpha-steroid 4-dehydrogenase 3